MTVKEVMTRSVSSIESSACVRDAAQKMKESDVGMLPVLESGKLVGVVTDRDLVLRAVCEDKGYAPVRDVMTKNPVCIEHGRDVEDAIGSMIGHRIGRLIVEDEVGRIVGVLSAADVAVACSGDTRVGKLASTLGGSHRHVALPAQ